MDDSVYKIRKALKHRDIDRRAAVYFYKNGLNCTWICAALDCTKESLIKVLKEEGAWIKGNKGKKRQRLIIIKEKIS